LVRRQINEPLVEFGTESIALPLGTAQIRGAWALLAGLDQLRDLQVVVDAGSALCPRGWVGLLSLDGTVTAVVPGAPHVPLARAALAGLSPDEVTNPEVVVPRFGGVAEILGPAALFYPTAALPALARQHHGVETAELNELGELLDDTGTADANESGLANISSPAFVIRDDAAIVAACGWQVWPGRIAHLCALTRPAYRRQGRAQAVAARAIDEAAAEGLLPQWRARPVASQQLAGSLGLVQLGAQLSLRLG
jgi:GNAT superfamily N-acetyltransferase